MRVATRVCLGRVCFSLAATVPVLLAQSQTPASIGPAQRRLAPEATYHRVYIISPLIGTGKRGDPKRPVLVPAPPAPGVKPPATAAAPVADVRETGLLGFQMQLSDDKQFALSELVFATPLAFQHALSSELASRSISAPALPATASAAAVSATMISALESAVPDLQIFERGQAPAAQILTAFQQKKAGFSFSSGGSVRP